MVEPGKVDLEVLDHMIENVIGAMTLPLGIAADFEINGQDYLIPMTIEPLLITSHKKRMSPIRNLPVGNNMLQSTSEMK